MNIDGDGIRDIVFDCLSNIKDPEFMEYTLEDLDIIDYDRIAVSLIDDFYEVIIMWKPTVKTCKFTENIGLSMRYKLLRDEFLKNFNHKIKYTFLILEDSHLLKEESKNIIIL